MLSTQPGSARARCAPEGTVHALPEGAKIAKMPRSPSPYSASQRLCEPHRTISAFLGFADHGGFESLFFVRPTSAREVELIGLHRTAGAEGVLRRCNIAPRRAVLTPKLSSDSAVWCRVLRHPELLAILAILAILATSRGAGQSPVGGHTITRRVRDGASIALRCSAVAVAAAGELGLQFSNTRFGGVTGLFIGEQAIEAS